MISRRPAAILLAGAVLAAGALTLLPIGWGINRFIVWWYYELKGLGAPDFLTIPVWEFLFNIALFAVPVWLARHVWPAIPWWGWVLIAMGASTTIELLQGAFLPREFALHDILANTLGAVLAASVWRVTDWLHPGRGPRARQQH